MEPVAAISNARGEAFVDHRAGRRLRVVPPIDPVWVSGRAELRQAATAVVERTGAECDLPEWWHGLCEGKFRFLGVLVTGTHEIGLLERRSPAEAQRHALRGRRLQILERLFEGCSENYAALELGICSSTVSAEVKQIGHSLGLEPGISKLPWLLMQLYYAARGSSPVKGRHAAMRVGEAVRDVLAIRRADLRQLANLSPAEVEVCQLMLNGLSHSRIAARRQTRVRTTANQVSAVFRKMNVSGRLELMVKLTHAVRAIF